ncbi:MAG: SDR family NAD(P)-dependent oxidoreductase [Ferruginibacter sp.]
MLKRRTILITGGGSGIGEALATNLSKDNKVIICGRNEEKLRKVATANQNVSYYVADIGSVDGINELFSNIANDNIILDVVINNAGIAEIWDIARTSLPSALIFESINANMSGAIAVTQQFINQADRSKDNAIINITSEVAFFPVSVMPLYSASKAGISVFTKALRVLLKDTTFKVVEILPPAVDTGMSRGLGNNYVQRKPADFAQQIIGVVNKGKTEYAPGSNVPMLKIFNKFLPKTGLKLIDKIIRKRLKLE